MAQVLRPLATSMPAAIASCSQGKTLSFSCIHKTGGTPGGTNYSNTGMISSTRSANTGTRLVVFALVAVAGFALVLWLERSTWKQAAALQKELTAIKTESFYLGVHLRAGIWRLDGRLLRFELSEDQTEREGFLRESRELSELIERTKPHLVTPQEIERLTVVQSAY